MAKMTKAQARKRLTEARDKIAKVIFFFDTNLDTRSNKELVQIRETLGKIRNKIN
tara:strand:+ start:400 stop:564 length:165 start_codon:yes stop_codon:yes gene_type:complete